MIDPKNTSFYNHDKMGEKPVIPNRVYKELLEKIDSGDTDEYTRCINEYTLASEQITLAEMKLNRIRK